MTAEEPRRAQDADDRVVTTASVREVLDAIDAIDLDAPWQAARSGVRLVLPRLRPLPDHVGALPHRSLPAGLSASLGLDIGPAMLFITEERLTAWGVAPAVAFDQAVANVLARVETMDHFALVTEEIDGVLTRAFQSREGWASSLLATPDTLCRVLGTDHGIVLAPMRDLILHLPAGTEFGLAEWLLAEFAAVDMNALDVPPLALVQGRLGRLPRPRGMLQAERLH